MGVGATLVPRFDSRTRRVFDSSVFRSARGCRRNRSNGAQGAKHDSRVAVAAGACGCRFDFLVSESAGATLWGGSNLDGGGNVGIFCRGTVLNQMRKVRIALAALLIMTAWAVHPRLFWNSDLRPSVSVRTFLHFPNATLITRKTSSGLTIYVPVETNQCWDAPLPCTPYFLDSLHSRELGKLESGFAEEYTGEAREAEVTRPRHAALR